MHIKFCFLVIWLYVHVFHDTNWIITSTSFCIFPSSRKNRKKMVLVNKTIVPFIHSFTHMHHTKTFVNTHTIINTHTHTQPTKVWHPPLPAMPTTAAFDHGMYSPFAGKMLRESTGILGSSFSSSLFRLFRYLCSALPWAETFTMWTWPMWTEIRVAPHVSMPTWWWSCVASWS